MVESSEDQLSNPHEGAPGTGNLEARARELVLLHGWNATSYQIINPGIELWFTGNNDAVIGYVIRGRFAIVAGAPVSRKESLANVMLEFEGWARKRSLSVCYFGAGSRLESIIRESPRYSLIALGAQPSWNPRNWAAIVEGKESLRAQISRARNKGVTVSHWDARRATDNADLRKCLQDWLATRGLPPLHFLVEPDTLSRLEDRIMIVAERNGSAVGFLLLSPVAARNGWLVEQIVQGQNAPNGTAELLLDFAMRFSAAAGSDFLTLGLAPLSEHSQFNWESVPRWLRVLLSWVRAHGNRFYNFQGLDRFKAKFQPTEWEDIAAAVNEPRFSLAALYAIAGAFGGRSPFLLVAMAIGTGVKREIVSLLEWIRRRAK